MKRLSLSCRKLVSLNTVICRFSTASAQTIHSEVEAAFADLFSDSIDTNTQVTLNQPSNKADISVATTTTSIPPITTEGSVHPSRMALKTNDTRNDWSNSLNTRFSDSKPRKNLNESMQTQNRTKFERFKKKASKTTTIDELKKITNDYMGQWNDNSDTLKRRSKSFNSKRNINFLFSANAADIIRHCLVLEQILMKDNNMSTTAKNEKFLEISDFINDIFDYIKQTGQSNGYIYHTLIMVFYQSVYIKQYLIGYILPQYKDVNINHENENDYVCEACLKLFNEMYNERNVTPGNTVLNAMISMFTKFEKYDKGIKFWKDFVVKNENSKNKNLNSNSNSLSKDLRNNNGSTINQNKANQLTLNSFVYNAMLTLYQRAYDTDGCMKLFDQMLKLSTIKLGNVTFCIILNVLNNELSETTKKKQVNHTSSHHQYDEKSFINSQINYFQHYIPNTMKRDKKRDKSLQNQVKKIESIFCLCFENCFEAFCNLQKQKNNNGNSSIENKANTSGVSNINSIDTIDSIGIDIGIHSDTSNFNSVDEITSEKIQVEIAQTFESITRTYSHVGDCIMCKSCLDFLIKPRKIYLESIRLDLLKNDSTNGEIVEMMKIEEKENNYFFEKLIKDQVIQKNILNGNENYSETNLLDFFALIENGFDDNELIAEIDKPKKVIKRIFGNVLKAFSKAKTAYAIQTYTNGTNNGNGKSSSKKKRKKDANSKNELLSMVNGDIGQSWDQIEEILAMFDKFELDLHFEVYQAIFIICGLYLNPPNLPQCIQYYEKLKESDHFNPDIMNDVVTLHKSQNADYYHSVEMALLNIAYCGNMYYDVKYGNDSSTLSAKKEEKNRFMQWIRNELTSCWMLQPSKFFDIQHKLLVNAFK